MALTTKDGNISDEKEFTEHPDKVNAPDKITVFNNYTELASLSMTSYIFEDA